MCIDPLLKIVPNKFIIFPLIEVGGLLKTAALSNLVNIFKKSNGSSVFDTFPVCLLLVVAAHDGAIANFGRPEVFKRKKSHFFLLLS